MTEAEWLECTNLNEMVEFLRGRASERKLRLWMVACCRTVWHLLHDERSRNAVDVAERFADDLAGEEELNEAGRAAQEAMEEWHGRADEVAHATRAAVAVAYATQAAARATYRTKVWIYWRDAALGTAWKAEDAACMEGATRADVVGGQSRLLRDVVGNYFRPPPRIESAWLRWSDGCVVKVAQSIYDERRCEDMPILADALEDAGCDNADILAHCRSGGPHVRGCWVVDLLLGKQ